jgi:hypothetical protein
LVFQVLEKALGDGKKFGVALPKTAEELQDLGVPLGIAIKLHPVLRHRTPPC